MNKDLIANRLKALRGNKPMSEVATSCGISVSALAMYETGQRIPRDEIKIRLASYYETSVNTLFFA